MGPRESGHFKVSADYVAKNPTAEPSATELAINVMYTAELLGRRLEEVVRPFGLSRGSHNALQIVAGATDPLTPGEVAARLTVTSATVTGLLDTLEQRGLVRRVRHPTDRRSVHVEITAAGRKLIDELVPALIEQEKRWATGLTVPRRQQLLRLLGVVQDQLRALEAEAS
jgi:DNA-binding MarR family transcriptional regulator